MATACLSFSGMILISFLPQIYPLYAQTFERICVTLALLSAILTGLSSASVVDYPEKRSLKDLLSTAVERRDGLFLFFLMFESLGMIITWIPASLPIPQFHIKVNSQSKLIFVCYENWFSLYLLFCIVLIWIYPVSKFLVFSRKAEDKHVRRASLIFGVSIFAVSSSSLITNLLLDVIFNITVPYISPFISAIFYLAIAYSFHESTVLIGAFKVFSQKFGLTHEKLEGEKILFEFDPSLDYSLIIRDFVIEFLAYGEEAFIFTLPNSMLHKIFKGHSKAHLYLLSTQVTSAKSLLRFNETLVPLENPSVLLGKIYEITRSNEVKKCLILDNLSVLAFHTEPTKIYKFLTYMIEETSKRKITVLVLFNPKAHDEQFCSAVKTLFNIQLAYDARGLRKIKTITSKE